MLDMALEKYEEALYLDPNNEYACSNIGVIFLKRENYKECLEYSNKALDLIEEF